MPADKKRPNNMFSFMGLLPIIHSRLVVKYFFLDKLVWDGFRGQVKSR